MKTIKLFVAVTVLTVITQFSYSQVAKPGEVATSDATSRVNSNESSAIDKGLSKTEGAIKGLFKKKKKPAETTAVTSSTQAQPVSSVQSGAGIKAYNNYDFIPGDKIIFEDDFADDQDGEFPSHWNLGKGQAVVNKIGDRKAFLLTDGNYAHVSPLIKSASYLNDPFTIEFDTYSTGGYQPHIYLYNTNEDATNAANVLGSINLGAGNSHGAAEVSKEGEHGIDLTGTYPADVAGENYLNKWHHIAIAFKKGQVKVYLDQYRVLVVPNIGFTPHAIDIEGIADAAAPIIIANFRMANGGGMNMLGKKFTDAKIVTHGINFDTDKATIKPESMGTLNMVAGILKENPEIKFEIDGHTDNTGTSPHNIQLSQQRADAVKAQLITMGVDAGRLTTKGFGDTKPMSDNLSSEGKANNRRVEFIKM